MKKIVVKFGGSNLKKKEDFQKIVKVIKSYDRPIVVVISAFFGVTNFMIEILEKVKDDHSKIEMLTGFLNDMKRGIISECISDEKIRISVVTEVEKRLSELERFLLGVHYIGEVPDFMSDKVLSYGERFSSLILAGILQEEGIDSTEILPEQLNLVTDGFYNNATLDFEASRDSVSKNLAKDKIYVVPGFYGMSPTGRVTLFGRGGSDYSAAAIAACIDAESLDIWKDVDGFMTADPKLVSKPGKIKSLTYNEAAELAYFGARILHPRIVEPLEHKGIPIKVFNVDNYTLPLEPQTVINGHGIISEQIIKSVTYSDDFSTLKLIGPGVGLKPGILAKATTSLGAERINIKSVITSQIQINLLLSSSDIERAYEIVKKINMPAVKDVIMSTDIAIIALVGEGFSQKCGLAARIFSSVAKKNINVEMIALGASEVAAYFVINKADKEEAIREIHKEFFGE